MLPASHPSRVANYRTFLGHSFQSTYGSGSARSQRAARHTGVQRGVRNQQLRGEVCRFHHHVLDHWCQAVHNLRAEGSGLDHHAPLRSAQLVNPSKPDEAQRPAGSRWAFCRAFASHDASLHGGFNPVHVPETGFVRTDCPLIHVIYGDSLDTRISSSSVCSEMSSIMRPSASRSNAPKAAG